MMTSRSTLERMARKRKKASRELVERVVDQALPLSQAKVVSKLRTFLS